MDLTRFLSPVSAAHTTVVHQGSLVLSTSLHGQVHAHVHVCAH